jgi:hypothetical protein
MAPSRSPSRADTTASVVCASDTRIGDRSEPSGAVLFRMTSLACIVAALAEFVTRLEAAA